MHVCKKHIIYNRVQHYNKQMLPYFYVQIMSNDDSDFIRRGVSGLAVEDKITDQEVFQVVLCRLIEIIDNYRNLASIGSYRLEFSTID